jgi:hypothetical protein
MVFQIGAYRLVSAMTSGIKIGAFVLTNERLVFLRRTAEREGTAVWKSHHYETEVSVDLKGVIGVKVKEDILEIICREGTETDVLYLAFFYEMDPRQPGYESIPKTVNPSEIAHMIDERREPLT